MARSTEERLQHIAEKVVKYDTELENLITKVMVEVKKRYESVDGKLWSLHTRMVTISRDQADTFCVNQPQLGAPL